MESRNLQYVAVLLWGWHTSIQIQMIYFYSGSGIGAVVAYRRDEQSRGLILPFLYPMVGFYIC